MCKALKLTANFSDQADFWQKMENDVTFYSYWKLRDAS